jgi:hypothetical protein
LTDHIEKAKRLLAEYQQQRAADQDLPKPAGMISLTDVLAAEQRVCDAERALAEFSASDAGQRPTLDRSGVVGTVIERHRLDTIERLQTKVEMARRSLAATKRDWIGIEDH